MLDLSQGSPRTGRLPDVKGLLIGDLLCIGTVVWIILGESEVGSVEMRVESRGQVIMGRADGLFILLFGNINIKSKRDK